MAPSGPAPAARHLRRGLVLGFLAYASWGLLSPIGKHLLGPGGFSPLWLNAIRFAIATGLLMPVLGLQATRDSLRAALRPGLLAANLLASLSLTLFLYSLPLLPATHATLGFYTAPLWTAALARLWLGERAGPWFLPAAAAILAGGYLALFGTGPASGANPWGLALAVASAVVWALYTVQLRKASAGVAMKPLLGSAFLVGTAWFLVLAVVAEGVPNVPVSQAAWGWMALYVAVPTLASFLLFNAAITSAPPGPLNVLVGAELAFTALFSWLLFGEGLDRWQLAGLAVVLVAMTAYLWQQARSETAA